ncbi:TonB-dependent receptor [Pseudoxanthomonas sp. 10H]|uniref:TonB-dependent receptor n=1 Tax=Pseudoxanthomonas sp. 10H TaxID=3242729 RepID=UPI003558D94F
MMVRKHPLSLRIRQALFGGLAAGAASIAFAAPQEGEAASSAVTLDTITVTAQSREQELQDVPIALQVVTAQMLDDVAAQDLSDIDMFVPGLVVDGQQPTQPSFELRGISTDDFGIGTDPAVGVYVDGVYAGRGGGVLLPFTDVARIEVLKGPQGTLFGRNTAAGAISIVTHRPGADAEARARLRLAEYGKRYVDAMANIPVGEDSAFRLNGVFNQADGWIQDANTGRDLAPEDNWATRAAFSTRFGDNTTAWVTWDHENLDQLGQATIGVVALPAAPGVPPLPVDEAAYLDPRRTPAAVDVDGNEESRSFDGLTLIVDHAFEWGNLTSTTALKDYDSLNRVEEDGTDRRDLYVDSVNTESNRNFYQEFKFSGSGERFDWVAGASYYREKADQTSEVNAYTDSVDTIVRNMGMAPTPDGTLFGFTSQVMQMYGIPLTLLGEPWNEKFVNSLETSAYALYGDVIWRVNDRFNLTFGLRYTRDEKEFSWFNDQRYAPGLDATLDAMEAMGIFAMLGIPKEAYIFDIAFIDPPAMMNKGVTTRDSDSWDDISPRLVADYHFTDDLMGFASVAKGYKAGGFNALQIGSQFDNEDVWNFEAGVKHVLPEHGLQYDASAYYYTYDNRQAIRLDTTTAIPRYVVDTSDLEAWGVDFNAAWRATAALTLDFNAGYIDATYKQYVTPEGIDVSGQPTGIPKWSMAAGAAYVWDLDEHGSVRAAVRYGYRGKTRCSDESQSQGTCGVSPALRLGEAQELANLRVGWTSAGGRYGVAVYGENLLDNQYVNGLATYGKTVLGTVGARLTPPRVWGVEFTAGF